MVTSLVIVFVIVYSAIAFEHPLRVNKSASALIGAGLLWTIYALSSGDHNLISENLQESIATTAQIVFFLMGAMTIVEMVDSHNGFQAITSHIKTTKMTSLLWLVGFSSFFLSAILDNLTTTIVMVSLMKKLLRDHNDRLFFAGTIVIAANAGGAWTPIGDVTTTMLWIGGQVTTINIMKGVLLPSLACLVAPLCILSIAFKRRGVISPVAMKNGNAATTTSFEQNLIFCLGIGILVAVPIFKAVTHLPPFIGMLLGLGILWLVGNLLHRNKKPAFKEHLTLAAALKRIDMSCLLFFVGILLAVATLEHTHILANLAKWLDHVIGRQDVIVTLIGLASAVIDNVPLVAGAIGMYDMTTYPTDSFLWEFMAYCAGTGGSMLIIGSAAGVAAMGLENINFFWYAKKIGWLAAVGYFAGIFIYIVQYKILHG